MAFSKAERMRQIREGNSAKHGEDDRRRPGAFDRLLDALRHAGDVPGGPGPSGPQAKPPSSMSWGPRDEADLQRYKDLQAQQDQPFDWGDLPEVADDPNAMPPPPKPGTPEWDVWLNLWRLNNHNNPPDLPPGGEAVEPGSINWDDPNLDLGDEGDGGIVPPDTQMARLKPDHYFYGNEANAKEQYRHQQETKDITPRFDAPLKPRDPKGAPRFPIDPAVEIAGSLRTIAKLLGQPGNTGILRDPRGVTVGNADRIAIALGVHPVELWPNFHDDINKADQQAPPSTIVPPNTAMSDTGPQSINAAEHVTQDRPRVRDRNYLIQPKLPEGQQRPGSRVVPPAAADIAGARARAEKMRQIINEGIVPPNTAMSGTGDERPTTRPYAYEEMAPEDRIANSPDEAYATLYSNIAHPAAALEDALASEGQHEADRQAGVEGVNVLGPDAQAREGATTADVLGADLSDFYGGQLPSQGSDALDGVFGNDLSGVGPAEHDPAVDGPWNTLGNAIGWDTKTPSDYAPIPGIDETPEQAAARRQDAEESALMEADRARQQNRPKPNAAQQAGVLPGPLTGWANRRPVTPPDTLMAGNAPENWNDQWGTERGLSSDDRKAMFEERYAELLKQAQDENGGINPAYRTGTGSAFSEGRELVTPGDLGLPTAMPGESGRDFFNRREAWLAEHPEYLPAMGVTTYDTAAHNAPDDASQEYENLGYANYWGSDEMDRYIGSGENQTDQFDTWHAEDRRLYGPRTPDGGRAITPPNTQMAMGDGQVRSLDQYRQQRAMQGGATAGASAGTGSWNDLLDNLAARQFHPAGGGAATDTTSPEGLSRIQAIAEQMGLTMEEALAALEKYGIGTPPEGPPLNTAMDAGGGVPRRVGGYASQFRPQALGGYQEARPLAPMGGYRSNFPAIRERGFGSTGAPVRSTTSFGGSAGNAPADVSGMNASPEVYAALLEQMRRNQRSNGGWQHRADTLAKYGLAGAGVAAGGALLGPELAAGGALAGLAHMFGG